MNDNNQASGVNGTETNSTAPVEAPAALVAAEAKATENRENYLRAVAEMENYRKRTERELENARKFAVERFAQDLVAVGDSLEAGIAAAASNPGPALLEGAQGTLKQLQSAFDKAGIKLIDPAGQPFDPEWHEAMLVQESADQPADTVLSVIQKGYSLNGRLLRPARVVVSKAPSEGAN